MNGFLLRVTQVMVVNCFLVSCHLYLDGPCVVRGWEPNYVYQYDYVANMAISTSKGISQHLNSQITVHAVDVNQIIFKVIKTNQIVKQNQ